MYFLCIKVNFVAVGELFEGTVLRSQLLATQSHGYDPVLRQNIMAELVTELLTTWQPENTGGLEVLGPVHRHGPVTCSL